ncbi:hypothetical protein [Arthrobacter sp. ov118]|uniref:hypothetical protein n=1 Tax=Arthrobacter sp. ov118 TaxID=1761747 RepID=UPI0008E85AEF|nr:hypothetical protein [Arthrobacter sp. ov118]SFU16323.1 hypothetical protein SAMN04487915_11722 [Arthrobacter sp. ov118]
MTEDEWLALARQLIEAVKDDAPSITDWISAVSTAATLVIAAIAAAIALFQLIQAKKLELDKSQPYVVMTMQESISPQFIDLVIKNYGQTAAYDVRVLLNPAPTRSQDGAEVVHLPEVIPVMAPGQEWRTHWDSASDRYSSTLPDRHEGTITYFGEKDIYKKQISSKAILDWSIYKSRLRMVEYGVHDLAKAVQGIRKNQEKWTENAGGSLSVYTRSGEAKDERELWEYQELKRELEKEQAAASPPSRRVRAKKSEPDAVSE